MSSHGGTMSNSSSKLFTGEAPKVTGLSPKEGPPGTKITIRGENLGKSEDDLIGVSICDVDCLIWAEWKSDKKILARSALAYGVGDVIVFTKSGGIGSCTVQFRSVKEIISPTKESAVWVNEDEHFTFTNNRHRNSVSPTMFAEQDPLGLLGADGDDSGDTSAHKTKLSESVFRDFFPEAQTDTVEGDSSFGNLSSNNFLPAWYLLENYNSIRFADLKRGLQNLKGRNSGSATTNPERGPIQLLKPNVLAVIECLDALKSVHNALKKDKQEYGHELTFKIEDSIKKANHEAHEIFDSILTRKDTVDSTRNALNVLQRYRFLFNLPSAIEVNIQRGDYDGVINDYLRVRSLFADTQVKVFQRVYKEVENRIERFKRTLNEKLIANCKNSETRQTDQIRRYIRHLMHLEVSGNPGWDCIETIKDQLLTQMIACRDKHLTYLNRPKILTDNDMNTSNEFDKEEVPQAVQFIEELTLLFNGTFEDLVTLCNHYVNGELFAKESKEQLKAKELIVNTEMFQRPIDQLVSLIRSAILPETVRSQTDAQPWHTEMDDLYVRWLPHCLRVAITCQNSLALLDLPCTSMLQQLQQFIFDLRVHSLTCVFKQAAEEVKGLSSKETWDVHLDDQFGTRTQLPLLFEAKVEEILRLVRETILQLCTPDEQDIFTKLHVQGQMKQLAQNLLAAFLIALENTLKSDGLDGGSAARRSSHFSSSAERLLIVICNCSFTNIQVIPRLHESFDKYNYPDMQTVIKMVQAKCKELEAKLFNRFVADKCVQVVKEIRPSMLVNQVPWYKLPRNRTPTIVSPYVQETLMNLISIQAEVFAICPTLVRKVMLKVIDAALEELLRIFTEITTVDDSANDDGEEPLDELSNFQANLDLGALQSAFDSSDFYRSTTSAKLLQLMRNRIRPISVGPQAILLQQNLTTFRQSMHLQMSAFKWNAEQVVIAL